MNDNILTARDLEKSFGGLKILKGVNFDVKRGEKLALIGPNGAGKSTLLNTIGGQGPATSGTIMFDGVNITKMTPNQRLHHGMGKSFQVNNLFWQFDVYTNIMMAIYGSEKNHFQFFTRFKSSKPIQDKGEYLLADDLMDRDTWLPQQSAYRHPLPLPVPLAEYP